MGIQYILPIYGFIKHYRDYGYAVHCLKLMMENPDIAKLYKMKMSPLGVLYFPLYVGDDIDEQFIPTNLVSQLTIIDAAMVGMNMDGVAEMKKDMVSPRTYYIKVIPTFLLKFWGIVGTQVMWILLFVAAFILTYHFDIFGWLFRLFGADI
jgi:hypothetical protein